MSDARDEFEPDWNLLPHAPEEFFGLAEGFDLRTLKRSYNRLIRRFKPEKRPDEFQRIRAAYESLSDALRYNVPTQRPRPSRNNTPPVPLQPLEERGPAREPLEREGHLEQTQPTPQHQPEAANVESEETKRPRRADVEVNANHAATTAPEETYELLRARARKSAEDYLHLALLSDVVHQRDPVQGEAFADWILEGLGEYEFDWGLTQLLREYLDEPHPLQDLASLLEKSVAVLPAERFQYVTERAWDRLLRERTFDNFRACLERCGDVLGRAVDHSQLVFYVHILKFVIWKADPEFLDDILDTLENHYHELDEWAQEEFETLGLFLEYKQRREEFVALGPCAQRIDQAMQDWCLLEEAAADARVLDCQYFLNLKSRKLLEEFADLNAQFSYALVPWEHVVADVLDRLEEVEPSDEATAAVHARDFLIRNSRRRGRTLQSTLGTFLMVSAMGLFLVVLATAISFAVRMCVNFFAHVKILAGLLDGCFAIVVFVVGLIVSLMLLWRGSAATKVVYAVARPDLLKLFRVAPMPVAEMAEVITQREGERYGEDDTIDDTDVIVEPLLEDAGIAIFAQAQICLRAADPEPLVEPLVTSS